MYRIYYFNKSIIIESLVRKNVAGLGYSIENESELSIIKLINLLESSPNDSQVVIYSSNPDTLKERINSLFVKKIVAGGLVQNQAGDFLFILKNGQWDLPKGHPDPGETLADAAKREVEEETGIGCLEIVSTLIKTEHFFQDINDQWILKESNWFFMKTDSLEPPRWQDGEAIADAKWIKPENLDSILEKAFASIKHVVLMHLGALA